MSQHRLENLKKLLAEEKASDNPSLLYIEDLEESIEVLEYTLKRTQGKGFEMVKAQ